MGNLYLISSVSAPDSCTLALHLVSVRSGEGVTDIYFALYIDIIDWSYSDE